MTAEPFPREEPVPDLAPDASPAAIREALVDDEREEFELAYRQALEQAAETLELTGVLAVVRSYHRIAVQTRQHGPDAHRRMLAKARLIATTGENPDGVPIERHRETIERRLGR